VTDQREAECGLGAGRVRRSAELTHQLGRELVDGRQDYDVGPVAPAGDEPGVERLGDLNRAREAVEPAELEQPRPAVLFLERSSPSGTMIGQAPEGAFTGQILLSAPVGIAADRRRQGNP
jgi:hypothetical protein